MERKAFTIIELLIVITIIAIISTVTVFSYNKTRAAAELQLVTDQLISNFREVKNQVRNSSTALCSGFRIADEKIYYVEAEYLNPFLKCDKENVEVVRDYDEKNLKVVNMDVEALSISPEKIDILYYPPLGATFIPDIDLTGQSIGHADVRLQLGMGSKINRAQVILNRKNGAIFKEYDTDE